MFVETIGLVGTELRYIVLYCVTRIRNRIVSFLIDTFVSSVFYFAHGSCSLKLTISRVGKSLFIRRNTGICYLESSKSLRNKVLKSYYTFAGAETREFKSGKIVQVKKISAGRHG